MAEKAYCEICDRKFKDADGLMHHNEAKHPDGKNEKTSGSSRKIRNWIITLVIIGVIVGSIFWIIGATFKETQDCKTAPANELNIGSHNNLALHIHADLSIIIDGEKQNIPGNMGVGNNLMRPVHTHDGTGHLHIEAPCQRDLTLGDFFDIWGKEFNENQIFDKTTENGKLTMMVDGKENTEFRNLILRDNQKIVIEYNSQ